MSMPPFTVVPTTSSSEPISPCSDTIKSALATSVGTGPPDDSSSESVSSETSSYSTILQSSPVLSTDFKPVPSTPPTTQSTEPLSSQSSKSQFSESLEKPGVGEKVVIDEGSVIGVEDQSSRSNANVIPSVGRPKRPPPINIEGLIALSPFPIHSSYIVKDKIGQGTWGTVHLAVERTSGLERAVKKIPKRFTSELGRFRQEITLLKGLDHPNIVRLYETFEDYANIYMVMEYCRGGELFDRVTQSKYFSEATAAFLMHQILSSICYIHRKNISHRDLKPENFLFLSSAERSPMKLIDFGLAKRFNTRRKMRTKVGTLYYVSPDVISGAYDEKCDVWSAGVILYLLLCGVPPFNGPTDANIIQQVREGELKFQESIWKSVSPVACDLLRWLLHRNPAKRPSADQALRSEWFALFSPPMLTRLCLPRPLSMPSLHQPNRQNIVRPLQQHFIPMNAVPINVIPTFECCELSILGVHSPLCPKNVAPRIDGSPRSSVSLSGTSLVQSSVVHPQSSFPIPPFQTLHRTETSPLSRSITLAEFDPIQTKDVVADPWDARKLEAFGNLARQLIPKWQRFAMHNQLKRAALRVVAQQLYDGDELRDLRNLFLTLDVENDGALSADEVASGVEMLRNASSKNIAMMSSDCPESNSNAEDILSNVSSVQDLQAVSSIVHRDASNAQFLSLALQSSSSLNPSATIQSPSPTVSESPPFPSMMSSHDDDESVLLDVDEMKSLVSDVALDGGDLLAYSDFLAATMDRSHYMDDGVLRAAFRVFDRNSDGKISASELRSSFGWFDSFYPRNEQTGKTCIDTEVLKILKLCDLDDGESIGFEEFKKLVRGNSQEFQ